jgi:hypothetical protein
MKRITTLLFLCFFTFSSFGQTGYVSKGYPENIPSFSYYTVGEDPVFDYIREYGPSYYFKEQKIGWKSSVTMLVRTYFNYSDNKNLSQIVLQTESGEMIRENTRAKVDDCWIWESIDPDEVESIIHFLSSVSSIKHRSEDPVTRVYNSRHGLLFLSKGNAIKLRFPDSNVVRSIFANDWIPLFKQAEELIETLLPREENQFVYQHEFNPSTNKVEGSANAHVKGRSVLGSLPKPTYNAQVEGIVVVAVKVDQYGTVTEAIPGADGTTVNDKDLWNAARSAALKAHFNQSASAPALQTGTITYIFKLK